MGVPFRIGVMQLTMEPLDEMLASARVMDEAGMDTVWLAEAYPWWRKHQMEAAVVDRGLGADGPRDQAAHDRLGDHLAVDAPSGPGRDGRTRRPGGDWAGSFRHRVRDVEDLPQQHNGRPAEGHQDARADARLGRRSCAASSAASQFAYDGKTVSADVPALAEEAHSPRWDVPVYVAGTAPLMQQLGGRSATGS